MNKVIGNFLKESFNWEEVNYSFPLALNFHFCNNGDHKLSSVRSKVLVEDFTASLASRLIYDTYDSYLYIHISLFLLSTRMWVLNKEREKYRELFLFIQLNYPLGGGIGS